MQRVAPGIMDKDKSKLYRVIRTRYGDGELVPRTILHSLVHKRRLRLWTRSFGYDVATTEGEGSEFL